MVINVSIVGIIGNILENDLLYQKLNNVINFLFGMLHALIHLHVHTYSVLTSTEAGMVAAQAEERKRS